VSLRGGAQPRSRTRPDHQAHAPPNVTPTASLRRFDCGVSWFAGLAHRPLRRGPLQFYPLPRPRESPRVGSLPQRRSTDNRTRITSRVTRFGTWIAVVQMTAGQDRIGSRRALRDSERQPGRLALAKVPRCTKPKDKPSQRSQPSPCSFHRPIGTERSRKSAARPRAGETVFRKRRSPRPVVSCPPG